VALLDFVEVTSKEELISCLRKKNYDALFVRLGIAIDDVVLESAPFLRFIVTPTTGLDHIDLDAAEKRHIGIISLRGETIFLKSIKSTAEHTWALLMALMRKLPEAIADTRLGNWRREPFLASELYGKTLGIIGYGRLGSMVATYGKAFGMKVLVNDTDPKQLQELPAGIEAMDLKSLLINSDIISLHIPSNESNRNFLDAVKIKHTKKGVIIVNTARGEIIDEKVFLSALESGHIGGAAIDVLDGDSSWQDHIPDHHPLLQYAVNHPQLILTPHMGGYGKESIENTRFFMAKKFLKEIHINNHLILNQ
jgi:D-3-phosphoglycerate dehydrogenase